MFNVKKGFLKFILFRFLVLLFTLIIFPIFQRGFSDAGGFLGIYGNMEQYKVSGFFSLNTFINIFILSILPTNAGLSDLGNIKFATAFLALVLLVHYFPLG